MQRWLKSREARGLKTTMVGSTFAIVNEESFTDYDKHRQQYREQSPHCRVVPQCELLLFYMLEKEYAVKQIKEHGQTYYVLSYEEFNDLATWVYRKRNISPN